MDNNNNSDASLVVIGSGIKFMSHLTTEAKAYITQSDKVLYLVNEPAMKEWIQQVNPQAESLDDIYFQHSLRPQSYEAITNHILDTLRQKQHVCVVLYGHPTVFSQPALDAVIQAKHEGYYTQILPGISAEDCLFSDLLIDPGSCGCQSHEATDFLLHRRTFDISSHLILWQVGVIGALGHAKQHDNTKGIKLLCKYLSEHYHSKHQITLYEAAQYPHCNPKIQNFSLEQLPEINLSPISTLYIPPARKNSFDIEMLRALDMDIKND